MNYEKAQVEALKGAISQNKTVRCCIDGDYVIFTTDGYTAFRIPKKQCFIDFSKLQTFPALRDYFVHKDGFDPGSISNVLYDNGRVAKITSGNKEPVYVKKSLLNKYFDSQALLVGSPLDPVQLVGNVANEIEAIVLPVRHYQADE